MLDAEVAAVLGTVESGPTRLEGGRSADLYAFRAHGRDLVLRVVPSSGSIAECEIQQRLAELGYPVPDVVQAGLLDDGRPYLIMRRIGGTSLFESTNPLRAFRVVPGRLATLMLELHAVDFGSSAAPDVEEAALSHVSGEIRVWLDAHRPATGPRVVCHGDLHALNVLVDGDDTAVIDWELAGLGDAAFDVARTKLLLHAVPMELSRGVRPIIQRLGRGAAARFEAAYTSTTPIDPSTLRWYEALHAARVISIVRSNAGGEHVVEGWGPTLPLLVRSLTAITGVQL